MTHSNLQSVLHRQLHTSAAYVQDTVLSCRVLLQLHLSGKMLSLGMVQLVYARKLQFPAEVTGFSSKLGRQILRSIGQFRAGRADTE